MPFTRAIIANVEMSSAVFKAICFVAEYRVPAARVFGGRRHQSVSCVAIDTDTIEFEKFLSAYVICPRSALLA